MSFIYFKLILLDLYNFLIYKDIFFFFNGKWIDLLFLEYQYFLDSHSIYPLFDTMMNFFKLKIKNFLTSFKIVYLFVYIIINFKKFTQFYRNISFISKSQFQLIDVIIKIIHIDHDFLIQYDLKEIYYLDNTN